MELTQWKNKLLNAFIIWNVGQGQWVTFIDHDRCRHFDVGGEVWPLQRLEKICGSLPNEIYISHWDEDHINGLAAFQNSKEKLCHGSLPDFPAPKKYAWINKLPKCESTKSISSLRPRWSEKELKAKRVKNESSVVQISERVLMPGDSPTMMEKKWANQIKERVEILILGHHGAKNSTSELLLKKLTDLKVAISSAREKRYGHPTLEVKKRLRKNQIPLLKTEDWGNLIFQ